MQKQVHKSQNGVIIIKKHAYTTVKQDQLKSHRWKGYGCHPGLSRGDQEIHS